MEHPARSCAEVVELIDEENAVLTESSAGVKLCVEVSPCVLHGGEKSPAPQPKTVGSTNENFRLRRLLL